MGTRVMGCLVLLMGLGVAAEPAADAPARTVKAQGEGLAAGDQFSVRITYSNFWAEDRLTLRGSSGSRSPAGRGGQGTSTPTGLGPVGPRSGSAGSGGGSIGIGGRSTGGGAVRGTSGLSTGTGGSQTGPGRGPISGTGTPPTPTRPLGEIVPVPTGSDPLEVDMTFRGEVRDGGRFDLALEVSRVHYFDSRGTNWTLEPRRRNSAASAGRLLEELVRRMDYTSDRTQREMIEEQLLGLAIFYLNGSTLDTALPHRNADARVSNMDEILSSRLPEKFPRLLWYPVIRFFDHAAARVVAPKPDILGPRSRFECRGVPYEVEKLWKRKKRTLAAIFGQVHDPSTGVTFKDSAVFDTRTGLVLEGKCLKVRGIIRGIETRYDATRWETKVTRFKPAARPDAGKGSPSRAGAGPQEP